MGGAPVIYSPNAPRRYGFVEFDDPRDADDAVYDLNGKELCGERVIVEHTKGPRRDGGYSGRSKPSPGSPSATRRFSHFRQLGLKLGAAF